MHTFSENWIRDETNHWHKATCEHSDEISGKSVHSFGDWVVTKEATETETGSKTKECKVCHLLYSESIPQLNHRFHFESSEWESNINFHWHTCGFEGCSFKYENNWHVWNVENTKAPSCSENGEKTYTCTICNYQKTESIPAIGHSYDYGWIITKAPTESETGSKYKPCIVCSEKKIEIIPKLKNSPSNLLSNKTLNGNTLLKTSEIDVIRTSTTVNVSDDSSWNGYVPTGYSGYDYYKGVFIKGRCVTLSPFAMGQYEVTQELFETVMGINPSVCTQESNDYKKMSEGELQKLRPVENVSWYQAIVFCNKLSILEGLEPCYSIEGITDWENFELSSIPTISGNYIWDGAVCDITKKGYRLPTEAEWEFAARGGDANVEEWKYSYAGVNTQKMPEDFVDYNNADYRKDVSLDNYGWCSFSNFQQINGTHEVGKKLPNRLNLYDMSGNVSEWVWDAYDYGSLHGMGEVTDPQGNTSGTHIRFYRGGSFHSPAAYCSVSCRVGIKSTYQHDKEIGFRIARSL